MMKTIFGTLLAILAITSTAHADELGSAGDVVVSCPIDRYTCLWHESREAGESYTTGTVGIDALVTRSLTVGVVPIFRRQAFAEGTDYMQPGCDPRADELVDDHHPRHARVAVGMVLDGAPSPPALRRSAASSR